MTTDIVISFDTTGSMYSILLQVRNRILEMVDTLFATIPDLRIGIIVHGNYLDEKTTYLSKVFDLSEDRQAIAGFVSSVGVTNGYNGEAAYEHVLWQTRALTWRAGSKRALMMIGDAHGPAPERWGRVEYDAVVNPKRLDWRNEAKVLSSDFGVKIFALHALAHYNYESVPFWKGLASISGGSYLTLDNFSEVVETLKVLFYASSQSSFMTTFVNELVADNQMTAGVAAAVEAVTGTRPAVTKRSLGGRLGAGRVTPPATYGQVDLVPVPPGRFQMLFVPKRMAIREFVEANIGETAFKIGAGYYQLGQKSVEIQGHKKIVLIDKVTGELWTGDAARKMLGLPPTGTVTVNPKRISKMLNQYDVFVQSTSVNRNLLPGDTFLYEVAEFV